MTETATPRPQRIPWWSAEAAILVVALLFRLLWLGIKPPHFDEGVNGYFVDLMRTEGYYRYDPTNFHGPLHFYILFCAQALFGRHVWALRLPVALISTGAVAMTLGFRRHLAPATCRFAGLAMALSPAMTFYGRYGIHESEMLLFLLVTTWGLLGLWRQGDSHSLAAAMLGATGCVLTKETYLIHFVALGLAFPALLLLEKLTRTPPEPRAPARWSGRQAWVMAGLCAALIVFFYSGNFLAWSALRGLYQTFHTWIATGTDADGGHAKKWHYWFDLLARYEWPTLLGMVAAVWLSAVQRDRPLRYLALTGAAAFTAYSLIRYKTPWCVISLLWPFLFHFGEAIRMATRKIDRWLAAIIAAVALGHSAYSAARLNFRHYTDETEPYVYVQTLPAINRVLDPLEWLSGHEAKENIRGYILFPSGDSHPLPWLLADYPGIIFPGEHDAEPEMDADILLVEDSFVSDMEDRLRKRYFREPITIRGDSGENAVLFLRASTFGPLFPDRVPEFEPTPAPAPVPTL